VINSHLEQEQNYLTRLINFFGPKNLLLPYAKEAIINTKGFESIAPFVYKNPEGFIQKLEAIQQSLAKMVGLNQGSKLATSEEISSAMNEINTLEKDLVYNFGRRDEIERALDSIEKSDIHQGFMQEMKSKWTIFSDEDFPI
jgi:hypothetical protein